MAVFLNFEKKILFTRPSIFHDSCYQQRNITVISKITTRKYVNVRECAVA